MTLFDGFYVFKPGPRSVEAAVAMAVRLGVPCLTDIKSVVFESGCAILKKSIYSGELMCEYRVNFPCCIVLAQDFQGSVPDEYIQRAEDYCELLSKLPLENVSSSYDPAGDVLSSAKMVFVAGRGVGSRGAFKRVFDLAERMGAKTGATRSAVMYGWAPMYAQIGVSGVDIEAEVCLVLGASGAEAFLAGLEKCRTVIAVNTDENAPIFRRADIGIIADCNEILAQLEELLDK